MQNKKFVNKKRITIFLAVFPKNNNVCEILNSVAIRQWAESHRNALQHQHVLFLCLLSLSPSHNLPLSLRPRHPSLSRSIFRSSKGMNDQKQSDARAIFKIWRQNNHFKCHCFQTRFC